MVSRWSQVVSGALKLWAHAHVRRNVCEVQFARVGWAPPMAAGNDGWDELLTVARQHDDISPIGPARVRTSRAYHRDDAFFDDGSRVGDNPDYGVDDGASISPLARGEEASPSMCRSKSQSVRHAQASLQVPLALRGPAESKADMIARIDAPGCYWYRRVSGNTPPEESKAPAVPGINSPPRD